MVHRSVLCLLTVLLLLPAAGSAQLRFQPPPASSRLNVGLTSRHRPIRVVSVADTVRPQTRWQEGWWAGVAIGALFGTGLSFSNTQGYPSGLGEKVWASLVVGTAIGVPLGIIGGLIGSTSKKPVASSSASP